MAPYKARRHPISVAPQGGLEQLQLLLRLTHDADDSWYKSADAVFISIDLEVSRKERRNCEFANIQLLEKPPIVKECGIATFDTRWLHSPALVPIATKLITTQQFSTTRASRKFIELTKCIFAETQFVRQSKLARAIKQCLRISDPLSPNPNALRNIVLVGHSPLDDLGILHLLGINFRQIAPVVVIIDTHEITRSFLGPESDPTSNMRAFSFYAVLTELGCPFEEGDLHNAGINATYTLHAMLMLAVRIASRQDSLTEEGRMRLEALSGLVRVEISERQRPESVQALDELAGEASDDDWTEQSGASVVQNDSGEGYIVDKQLSNAIGESSTFCATDSPFGDDTDGFDFGAEVAESSESEGGGGGVLL